MARASGARLDDEEISNQTGADEVPEVSLREQIESARDEVIDTQNSDAGGDAGFGRERDGSGRFAKRSQVPEGGERNQPAALQKPQSSESATTQDSGAQATVPREASERTVSSPQVSAAGTSVAPQGWSASGKAVWAQLPDAARVEIIRRENDMHRQFTSQDQERSLGREIGQIAQANQDAIRRSGATPVALFNEFVSRMNVLQGSDIHAKAQMLREIAQRNGIDARTLLGIAPAGGAPPASGQPPQNFAPLPPALADMQRQIAELRTLQAQRQQQEERQNAERQQREENDTLNEIMAFRSKPEARFFDDVRDHMIALLNGNVASSLNEAYSQAVWARPDIRAILESEAQAQQRAKAQGRQAVSNAKAKAGSVRGGAGGTSGGGATQNRSLREELAAGFAEARSRV